MKIFATLAWLLTIFLCFYVLRIGKELLIPLAVAVMIWYLTNALAAGIGRIKVGRFVPSRPFCLTSSVLLILGGIGLIVNLVSISVIDIISSVTIYEQNLERVLTWFYHIAALGEPPTIGQLLSSLNLRTALSRVAVLTGAAVSTTGIVLVYLILLFLEQGSFGQKFKALFPDPEGRSRLFRVIAHIDEDIRMYIGIKTLTSALTGIASYVVMALVELDFAVFWAILIFLFNYIPTFGSIAATLFPAALALIQFDNLLPFVVVLAGIGTLQFVIGNILEPRLMGSRLNLSPLIILLSLALWGTIWGVTGMILSVPLTAMLTIILSHFPRARGIVIILSKSGRVDKN